MKQRAVTVETPGELKTREQEKRYHAMLNDIARQCSHLNENFDADSWKRLCVDMFRKECLQPGADPRLSDYWKRNGFRVVPSLDGSGLVVLGSQTRNFPKYVACAFTEWLFSFGAERKVEWTDPTVVPLSAYSAAA